MFINNLICLLIPEVITYLFDKRGGHSKKSKIIISIMRVIKTTLSSYLLTVLTSDISNKVEAFELRLFKDIQMAAN